MAFNVDKAARDMVSGFKFKRVGDKVRMRITDIDEGIEIDDKDKGGTGVFIAVQGEVIKAVGGNVDDDDNVTDVEPGEIRSILLQVAFRPYGKDVDQEKYSIIAKAIAKAVKAGGGNAIEVGAELVVHHHELGKRTAENPSWSRPKFYEATYTPPAKSVAVASFGDSEPF